MDDDSAPPERGRELHVLVVDDHATVRTGLTALLSTDPRIAVVDQATAVGLRTGWGTWEADGCPTLWGWREALAPVLAERSPVTVSTSGHGGTTARDAASASASARLAARCERLRASRTSRSVSGSCRVSR